MATASQQSERFRSLERELRLLREHLLPRKFQPTGSYPDRVYTRALAYRVLAHAEFECYLEDRVTDLYRSALRSWDEEGHMSKVIACMLAFSGAPMDEPPETLEPSQPSEKKAWDEKLGLSAKITKAARTLDYAIRHNNGIKEQNILRLLLPIGIEADQIDGIWLATVNSFVEDRGRAAHTSAETSRTQQPPDPYTEVKTVEGLLVGFRDIDRAINKLMPL